MSDFLKSFREMFLPHTARRYKWADGEYIEVKPYMDGSTSVNPEYENAILEELSYNPLGKPCECGSHFFILRETGNECGQCGLPYTFPA